MQRYNIIFIYPNELTLIKFFLHFYTFGLHTHTRVHYTRQKAMAYRRTHKAHQCRQKAYICVYPGRLVVFFSSSVRQKGIQKPKRKLSPYTAQKSSMVG